MSDLVTRLAKAADDEALGIGEAWALLDQAAAALIQAERERDEAHAEMEDLCRRLNAVLDEAGIHDMEAGYDGAFRQLLKERDEALSTLQEAEIGWSESLVSLGEDYRAAADERDEARAAAKAHAIDAAAHLRHLTEARALLREIDEWFRQEGAFPDYIQARLDAVLGGKS